MSCSQQLNSLEANNSIQWNTSCFKVESWWHTTFWTAPCHSEHGVSSSWSAVHRLHPSTQRCLVVTFGEVSFLPQICILLETVLLKLCTYLACSRVGTHLSKLWLTLYRAWIWGMGTLSQNYSTILLYILFCYTKYLHACRSQLISLAINILSISELPCTLQLERTMSAQLNALLSKELIPTSKIMMG